VLIIDLESLSLANELWPSTGIKFLILC